MSARVHRRRRPRPDAGARLLAAIVAQAGRCGCRVEPLACDQREWHSATFTGIAQRIAARAHPAAAREAWLATLPATPFAIPGHLVVEVAATVAGDDVVLSTLLLHDP